MPELGSGGRGGGGQLGQGVGVVVEGHDCGDGVGQGVGQRRGGHHGGRPRVAEHEGQPLQGVVGVEGQVGPARLPDPQHPHHGLGAPRQADAHHRLGSHPDGGQVVAEAVGRRVELGVGEGAVVACHRHRVGGDRGLGLEGVEHGLLREGRRRCVPVDEHRAALDLGQHLQLGERAGRVGRDGGQQDLELGHQPLSRGRLEQLGGIREPAARASVGAFPQAEVEIESGGTAPSTGQPDGPSASDPDGRGGGCEELDHDLDDRVAAKVPRWSQGLHQGLERQVLVCVCARARPGAPGPAAP